MYVCMYISCDAMECRAQPAGEDGGGPASPGLEARSGGDAGGLEAERAGEGRQGQSQLTAADGSALCIIYH